MINYILRNATKKMKKSDFFSFNIFGQWYSINRNKGHSPERNGR